MYYKTRVCALSWLITKMILHHCMTFRWPPSVRFFVHKTANSNLSTASTALNHKEHYRKQLYYVTRTKHDYAFPQCIF